MFRVRLTHSSSSIVIGKLGAPYEHTKAFPHAINGPVFQRLLIIYKIEPETSESLVTVDLAIGGVARP